MLVVVWAFVSAFLIGLAVTLAISWKAAIFPAIFIFVVVFFLMNRRVGKALQARMLVLSQEMNRPAQARSPEQREKMVRQRLLTAIQKIQEVKDEFKNKALFVERGLSGQIGVLYFNLKEYEKARPFLEVSSKGFVQQAWEPRAMLGVLHYKKKDLDAMDSTFESASKRAGKQGLLWGLWAYLHWKSGNADKAIEILNRGQKELGDKDDKLNTNLLNLQNGKKMVMKGYGEPWYQFQLEVPPLMLKQRGGQVKFQRR